MMGAMRARFSFAAGAWAVATTTATLITWAGVQIVTSAVTPSPVAVMPSSQIRSINQQAQTAPPAFPTAAALPLKDSLELVPQTAPPSTPAPPPGAPLAGPSTAAPAPSTTVPAGAPVNALAVTEVADALSGGSVTTTPPTTSQPPASRSVASSSGASSTGTSSTSSPSTVQDFAMPGGNAELGCAGSAISVLSASPADGYQLYVTEDGPQEAQVYFVDQQYQDSVTASCVGGQPQGQASIRGNFGGWGGAGRATTPGTTGPAVTAPSPTTSAPTTSTTSPGPTTSTTSPGASSQTGASSTTQPPTAP